MGSLFNLKIEHYVQHKVTFIKKHIAFIKFNILIIQQYKNFIKDKKLTIKTLVLV